MNSPYDIYLLGGEDVEEGKYDIVEAETKEDAWNKFRAKYPDHPEETLHFVAKAFRPGLVPSIDLVGMCLHLLGHHTEPVYPRGDEFQAARQDGLYVDTDIGGPENRYGGAEFFISNRENNWWYSLKRFPKLRNQSVMSVLDYRLLPKIEEVTGVVPFAAGEALLGDKNYELGRENRHVHKQKFNDGCPTCTDCGEKIEGRRIVGSGGIRHERCYESNTPDQPEMSDRPFGDSIAKIEFEEEGVPEELIDEAIRAQEIPIHEGFVDFIRTQTSLKCGFKDSMAAEIFLKTSAAKALPHERDFTLTVDGNELTTNGRCHGCDKIIVGNIHWSSWGKTCRQCSEAC